MKKKFTAIAAALLILLSAAVIYKSSLSTTSADMTSDDTLVALSGTWSEPELQPDGSALVAYRYQLPLDRSLYEPFLLVQSYYTNFEVLCGSESLYTHSSETADGYLHLLSLGELFRGEQLTIVFSVQSTDGLDQLYGSRFYVGDQSSIYNKILYENIYALIFVLVAIIMSIVTLGLAFAMRNISKQRHRGIASLGFFILSAGIWVLTDSNLLLLVTAHAATVNVVSFLSFLIMPVFLLRFTKQIIEMDDAVYQVLNAGFCAFFVIYLFNYMLRLFSAAVLLVFVHGWLVITMLAIMYYCLCSRRIFHNRKLSRVLLGYVFFIIFSVAALATFYMQPFSGYSQLYAFGAAGFIIFLFDAACREAYEQLEHNVMLESRAKLAYTDAMTNVGNRAAFHEKQVRDQSYAGPIAYVMADINNLKEANDRFGHAAGDELIQRTAQCLKDAVGTQGECYRIGGDEFIACINNISEADVKACVGVFYALVERGNAAAKLPLSVAAGCVWSDGADRDLDLLFRQADAAMYKEKQRIKGGVAPSP